MVPVRIDAAAHRAAEDRCRTVLAGLPGGYAETGPDGTVTFVNAEFAALAGAAPLDVIGTELAAYAAVEARAEVRRHVDRILREGGTEPTLELRLVGLDHAERLVMASFAAVHGPADDVAGVRVLLRDVTDRVEARRALERSEERHRLLARVTREVIWDADLTTGRTTWSGAVRDVFGLPEDEVEIDIDWWRARIHPDDVAGVLANREAALTSAGEQFLDEYRLRDQSGGYVSVRARGLIMRDEHGRPIRFLGSMLDVTEFRRQEEELRQARRVAEEANQAKSLFLANVSHELRTPLTSVIAGTEMMMDTPLSAPQQRLMERVNRSGQRLLTLVKDLLDFSSIEAGDLRLAVVPFDPAAVVQHAADWAHEACAERGLAFAPSVPPLPARLLGDPDRLGQVLGNLLENAVKFTGEGSVALTVAVVEEWAEHARLRFTVEDTGIGIAPEHHDAIFASFSQADASITRRHGGNGLGLAISKEIVQLLGGTIGLDSEPGRGSTFVVEIPFGVVRDEPVSRAG